MKRFILAFIAAYIFMFLWGWLLNGVLLKDVYAETPNLWRSQSEMMRFFHWIVIGQALLIFAFVAIYARGFAGGGVMAGIRLGVLLEIAAIGMRLAIYAGQPFSGKFIFFGGDRGDRQSSRHLRSPTVSRKIDHLREHQRPHRDDNRRRDCGSDL